MKIGCSTKRMRALCRLLLLLCTVAWITACSPEQDKPSETERQTVTLQATGSPEDSLPSEPSTDTEAAETESDAIAESEKESETAVMENPVLRYPVLPKATEAEVLYLMSQPSDFSDRLAIASLQGLVARSSSEQIFLRSGAYDFYVPYIESEYGCRVEEALNGEELTLRTATAYFKDVLKGYILCADDDTDPSVNVAISLAGVLDCIIATPSTKDMLEELGLTCVLDVTDKNDQWLRDSEYWDQLSRRVAVEQPCSMTPRLADYAVMCGAYFNYYDGNRAGEHKRMYQHLTDNAVVLGYNNDFGEYDTVKSLSEINVQLIPSDHAFNLSVHSGFTLTDPTQKTAATSDGEVENVHTVCFILSDGDNMQWIINDYSTTDRWFSSPLRGQFNMGWGLPTAAGDMIAPMVSYLYDQMTEKDEFIMQLSGIGYTFPSLWEKEQRQILAANVAQYMERSGLRYMEILDTNGFNSKYLEDFTAEDGIEGIFYIDYANYASAGGNIIWTNGKPTVSARYRLWADTEFTPETLSAALNQSSTDVTSKNGYSFVIVHAWSGMKDGQFGSGGSAVEAVAAVIAGLEEHVEVVTPSEFMERIKANIPHN